MTEHYYIVEVPGPKDHKSQVIKASRAFIVDGSLIFYQDPELPKPGDSFSELPPIMLIAAFAPGRWITCKLGVMKSPDAEKSPEAAPDAA